LQVYVGYRLARWAAETSPVQDMSALLGALCVFVSSYTLVGVVTAVVSSSPVASVGIPVAVLGCLVVSGVGGGLGLWLGYAAGPGFALGTGTVVSPGVVTLGAVPAFPLLAALPADGPAPWWRLAVLAVPPLVGGAVCFLLQRRDPSASYSHAALRGLGSGA